MVITHPQTIDETGNTKFSTGLFFSQLPKKMNGQANHKTVQKTIVPTSQYHFTST
jgi:hypothetical protein